MQNGISFGNGFIIDTASILTSLLDVILNPSRRGRRRRGERDRNEHSINPAKIFVLLMIFPLLPFWKIFVIPFLLVSSIIWIATNIYIFLNGRISWIILRFVVMYLFPFSSLPDKKIKSPSVSSCSVSGKKPAPFLLFFFLTSWPMPILPSPLSKFVIGMFPRLSSS